MAGWTNTERLVSCVSCGAAQMYRLHPFAINWDGNTRLVPVAIATKLNTMPLTSADDTDLSNSTFTPRCALQPSVPVAG